jgi:hypothetical protein
MIVATFGPSTAWVGKTITFDDGRFTLEDLGQIEPHAVVDYDRQGHLQWAYDGLREWAYELAGQALPQPAPAAPAVGVEATPADAPMATAPLTTAPVVAAPSAGPAPVTPAATQDMTPATATDAPRPIASDVAPHLAPPTAPVAPAETSAEAAAPAESGVGAAQAQAAEASAAERPAGDRNPRRVWFVLGGVVVLALLVGIVAAGGRLRDGLGVAFTLVAIVAVVALVVALVRPGALGRWLPGAAPRAVQLACVGAAAVCLIFAALLWWMPHYEVVAPADTRIGLDETPEIALEVYNRGLLGGTYSATYSVDGKAQDAVQFPLGGGQGREITLSLPGDTERGPVLLSLGGASIEAQAVAPPAFAVARLQVSPSPAKLGDDVTLTTSVENTGDLAGTFSGRLLVDGHELLKQPVELKPGQTREVTYDLTADRAGEYELALGDATADFVIVKPVRLANGYVIKRSPSGGKAYVKVTNKTGLDAVAALTRSGNKTRPVVAVYVRDGKTATIKGIPDGTYVLWDCCGSGFNWTMRDFFSTTEYKRWLKPLTFNTTASTKSWTSYWSDSSYNYSQKHSQTTTHWTNWTVTLGMGESKYTKTVSENGFPRL